MTLVASFLVSGHPLPKLSSKTPAHSIFEKAFSAAAAALDAAKPDVIIAYSTQWMAVLDELWQTRPYLEGVHVDENWYDYGDLPFDIKVDTELAEACVQGTRAAGVSAKSVDYEGFPVDTGTIVMAKALDPHRRYHYVLASNNLYHNGAVTEKLASVALETAAACGRRVALVGVGGLSGTIFRDRIDLKNDRIARDSDDAQNRRLLDLLKAGDRDGVRAFLPEYASATRADMGMKHLSWLLGGMGESWTGAEVLGYGPAYGTGQAVVQFQLKH